MSDSVDRVFAHALQTVRKIPRTGSARPPPDARLKLYGLYKQSMEGDIAGVMTRPHTPTGDTADAEAQRAEVEKWEAWHAQAGLSKTEAKRRYINTLIETMHRYASATPEARELVAELEFVWDQIRSNVPSTHSPNNHEDEDEESEMGLGLGIISPAPYGEGGEDVQMEQQQPQQQQQGTAWRGRVEKALSKMTTEVAALREQLESRRAERRRTRSRRVWVWVAWCVWAVARHLVIEAIFWALVMLWMRRRGDRRAQEALKIVGRFVKEGLREMGLGRRKTGPR
ncbi:acyl CoA binding protein-domain-containing protein [Sphaerosporella brunnea]|uniref:Acyl CoA binding protein-domain-containing protein n=1 Tax=Sphaerosporella brunnea TaxID=1250544 RepID=A0A5J5F6G3_9PEZI|nr:acyl CoA binding protein-domain-containing protein [Sphaerosporella brunnea]